MSRLIDEDDLLNDITSRYCINCDKRKGMKNGKYKTIYEIGDAPCRACMVDSVMDWVVDAPTVDAVEIVRCKECKYYDDRADAFYCVNTNDFWNPDDFCSRGERR